MIFVLAAFIAFSVGLIQAVIIFPIHLATSFHLPLWLSLTLGGILFSWLIGE